MGKIIKYYFQIVVFMWSCFQVRHISLVRCMWSNDYIFNLRQSFLCYFKDDFNIYHIVFLIAHVTSI